MIVIKGNLVIIINWIHFLESVYSIYFLIKTRNSIMKNELFSQKSNDSSINMRELTLKELQEVSGGYRVIFPIYRGGRRVINPIYRGGGGVVSC